MPDDSTAGELLARGAEFRIWVAGDDEFDIVNAWLYDTLHNDITVTGMVGDRIVEGTAIEGTDVPFIAFMHVASDDDDLTFGNDPVAVLIYQVVVYDQWANFDRISKVYKRLVPLLHNVGEVEVSNGVIMQCQRKRALNQETEV